MGWKLALVCMISLPLTTAIMGVISWVSNHHNYLFEIPYLFAIYKKLSTKFTKQELEAYGLAGTIAEEVLSSIRTVVAFDGQAKEFDRYEKHLITARKNNIKKSMFTGISNAVLWFFVYACYALSFWYGVGLIIEENDLPEDEKIYTAGNMVAVNQ